MKRALLLLLLLFPVSLWAQPLGEVLLIQGKLKLHSPTGDQYYSKPGTTVQVQAQDEIQTAKETRAKLFLRNKLEVIELYSQSLLSLIKYAGNDSQIGLPVGKARFKIKYKGLKVRPRFRLRTANALVGVKGTEFVAETLGGSTNLLTLEGTVTLANLSAPEISISVTRNQASRTAGETKPSAPVTVPPKAQAAILKSDSGTSKGWEAAGIKSEPKPKKEKKQKKKKKKKQKPKKKSQKSKKESSKDSKETSDSGKEKQTADEGGSDTGQETAPADEGLEGGEQPSIAEPEAPQIDDGLLNSIQDQVGGIQDTVDQVRDTVDQEQKLEVLKEKAITIKVTD